MDVKQFCDNFRAKLFLQVAGAKRLIELEKPNPTSYLVSFNSVQNILLNRSVIFGLGGLEFLALPCILPSPFTF